MGISTLAAIMVVADIAFFVIIALFLIIGAIKGVAKTFGGFFFVIATILIALILMGLTVTPVQNMDFSTKLETSLESKASGWGDVFTEPVTKDADGNYCIYDGAKLSEYGGIKGKFANFLAEKFMKPENEGSSLAGIAAGMLTTLIIAIVLFVLYCIAISIVKLIIKACTKGMHNSESGAVKAIDKILGAILNAALAVIFILLVLAILKSINIATVNDFINDSTICSYFYNSNPISQVFAKIFGA